MRLQYVITDFLAACVWKGMVATGKFATRNMQPDRAFHRFTLLGAAARLPVFEIPEQYVELPGGNSGNWRFDLNRNVTIPLKDFSPAGSLGDHLDPGQRIEFYDEDHRLWAWIDHEWNLTISCGYAWNGCSPKWWAFGRWWGTPDPVWSRLASLVHDLGYQMMDTEHFPLLRDSIDVLFYNIMVASGANPHVAGTYYGAVQKFGAAWHKPNNCYSKIATNPDYVP